MSAGKIKVEDTYATTMQIIAAAKGIDFTDNDFHASGAGRVLIRNVIGVATSLIAYEQLRGGTTEEHVKELLARYGVGTD